MAQLAFRWPGALVKEFESALDDYEQANYELDKVFRSRGYGTKPVFVSYQKQCGN